MNAEVYKAFEALASDDWGLYMVNGFVQCEGEDYWYHRTEVGFTNAELRALKQMSGI